MTVRMTRVKSDITTRPRQFPLPDEHVAPDGWAGERSVFTDDRCPSPSDPEPDPRTSADPVARPDGQRARRVARRQRRILTVVCALVVAACLALTLLIVDLARTRPTGPQPTGPQEVPFPPAAGLAGDTAVRPAVPFLVVVRSRPSTETPGAEAPEGGNR